MFFHPVPRWKDRLPVVSSGYLGSRPDHFGLDIMYKRLPGDPEGLPTTSPGHFMPNGVPTFAFGPGRVTTSKDIGTGGYVVIDHAGGLQSHRMHLKDRRVEKGDTVNGDDVVGTISHNPSGYKLNHLHFGLKQNGQWVDPEPVLNGLPVLDTPTGKLLQIAVVGFVVWGVGRFLGRW